MIYMFLAQGFEEVEAIATLDVIRRAGIEIQTAGVGGRDITGSHGVTVKCDLLADAVTFSQFDGMILPGGMPGTINLMESSTVNKALDYCSSQGKLICAICAAPMILGKKGLLRGKKATCFPGFEKDLEGAEATGNFCITDGNIITGKGMGSAVVFGLEIVKYYKGKDAADALGATLQMS